MVLTEVKVAFAVMALSCLQAFVLRRCTMALEIALLLQSTRSVRWTTCQACILLLCQLLVKEHLPFQIMPDHCSLLRIEHLGIRLRSLQTRHRQRPQHQAIRLLYRSPSQQSCQMDTARLGEAPVAPPLCLRTMTTASNLSRPPKMLC